MDNFAHPPCCFKFHKEIILREATHFTKVYCHLQFHYSVLRGASVVFISQIRTSAILLLILGNWKVRCRCSLCWFCVTFIRNVMKTERCKECVPVNWPSLSSPGLRAQCACVNLPFPPSNLSPSSEICHWGPKALLAETVNADVDSEF
jgi:hypothetical protein